jgi:hypothetical protein
LNSRIHGERFVEVDRRQRLDTDDDVALIHGRHEGLAELGVGEARRDNRRHGRDHHLALVGERPGQRGRIEARGGPDQPRLVVRNGLEEKRGRDRNHGERQQQRASQRKDDGKRYRDEQFALETLQREQRNEDDDDDEHARGDRLQHLAYGSKHGMDQRRRRTARLLAEVADDVFKPTQAHQVGGHADGTHGNQRDDDGQGQAERDHQGSPPIAEEQQQQDDDEDGSFAQRADDGADGAADQPASIIEHVDGNAFRQRRLQFLQTQADVAHELTGIGAAQAKHQPLDRFAMAIDRDGAIARQRADLDSRHLVDPDRDALAGVDHDRANVVDGADAALDPDQGAVFALVDAAGAVVTAVGLHGTAKQFKRDAARRARICTDGSTEEPTGRNRLAGRISRRRMASSGH